MATQARIFHSARLFSILLELSRAPCCYGVHGVKYIHLVSLGRGAGASSAKDSWVEMTMPQPDGTITKVKTPWRVRKVGSQPLT